MNKQKLLFLMLMLCSAILFNSENSYAQTEANRTKLGYAIQNNNVAAVKDLLSKGTDPNKTHDKETPLVLSVKQKNDEIFNLLVNAKRIKIDAMSTYIWTGNGSRYTSTALIEAVNQQNPEYLRILLEKGANPDLFDKNISQQGDVSMGFNAIMHAILINKPIGVEMAEMLIEKARNINASCSYNPDGKLTSLILACRYPLYNELSKSMIAKAAFLEMPGADNPALTAAGQAILGSNPEMLKYLLDAGAKIDDKKDKAFLHLAMALGIENLESIRILLDYGIDPNIRFTATKYPVINHCVKCKNRKVLELMIERGADVNAKDGIGQSVLVYAKGGKKVKKNVALLIKHGATE
jgi:ankyrin repeat protein